MPSCIALSTYKYDTHIYLDIKKSNTQTANMHPHPHPHTHTHTMTHTSTSGQGDWRKSFPKEKGFQGRFEGPDRGWVTVRSGEFVPCCWSLVRERALTTWLCAKGWHSEHSDVCRRTELPRGSVKVKMVWEVGRGRTTVCLFCIIIVITTKLSSPPLKPSTPSSAYKQSKSILLLSLLLAQFAAQRAGFVIERFRGRFPGGAAGEFSSPQLTFCANS